MHSSHLLTGSMKLQCGNRPGWPLFAVAVVALFIACTLPASASVPIFTQTSDQQNLLASQNDTSNLGNFATTYDNFVLSASDEITHIDWTGGYFNPPAQGQITSFTINFYTDNGNQPGTLCCSTQITGNASETFLGNFGGFPYYTYSADLGNLCCFTAGTEYWVSIVPTLDYPPQWGWASSSDGDQYAIQDFYMGGRGVLSNDLTFTLWGDPCGSQAPEPGSLLLMGSGLMGVVGLLRRRVAA
jgi:hypothetical protein